MKARLPIRTVVLLACAWAATGHGYGQGGDQALKAAADKLFEAGEYAKAYPMYSQLVSLAPQDHELNYKFGTCALYGGDPKPKAIGYLKFAVGGPDTPELARYFLGKAYQLDYQFDEALAAYQHFKGTADKKLLAKYPVDILEQQCRNGKFLLSSLKDIRVLKKTEVAASDFFRFYDLSSIGGKIVVTPDELLTALDRKSKEPSLVFLPDQGGAIYFGSYGKDGKTGKDIYRTEVLPTGGYATPVKLAGYINTDQDEDFAVMAPDGRSFYFCSKGHNSMGGYDVFKSTHDPGMDVFSPPVNLDFAVNTPADELLYVVGPDGQQACFASDRDSKQGTLNVYRVSTTQTPINITVFKGTFASAFDPTDKEAHIIVEDELTRERVADVTTDANGEYVLALPRGGRYKVLVEGGPGKRSYLTTLDIPPATKPQAFQQEIALVERGGVKVEVTNHFDAPLNGDIMALALDEIRRRARLDVNATEAQPQTLAQDQAPAEQDPLQAAGFDGTATMDQVLSVAGTEASFATAQGKQQGQQSASAMDLALENLDVAEEQARLAADLVKQADAASDEAGKVMLMRQAAEAKQFSMEASARAYAAYQVGKALEQAATRSRQRAESMGALNTRIAGAHAAKDGPALTAALKELKADIDERKGPDARPDERERMRRAAADSASAAARLLRQANVQREEETMLIDRVGRLRREADEAKGRKKETLLAELATLEDQQAAMHQEVEEAFGQARLAEEGAASARGQTALVKYLEETPDAVSDPKVDATELASLQQRLAAVRQGNENLDIGPQYMPLAEVSAEERERRMFDWAGARTSAGVLASNTTITRQAVEPGKIGGNTGTIVETQASVADGAGSSEGGTNAGAVAQGITPQRTDSRKGQDIPAGIAHAPAVQGTNTGAGPDSIALAASQAIAQQEVAVGLEDSPSHQAADTAGKGSDADQGVESAKAPGNIASQGAGTAGAESAVNQAAVQAETANAPGNAPAQEHTGTTGTGSTVNQDTGNQGSAVALGNAPPQPGANTARELSAAQQAAVQLEADHEANATAQQPGQEHTRESSQGDREVETPTSAEEQAFIQANQLAELEQLRAAEKNRARKDSLDEAIAKQKALIASTSVQREQQVPGTTHEETEHGQVVFVPLEFDLSMLDEQLTEEFYPGFTLRRKAIMEGPGSAEDKAAMLHVLEMQLVDSIDARTALVLTVLERDPARSDSLLPRLARWRTLKEAHVAEAEQALAAVDKAYDSPETRAMEDAVLAAQAGATEPLAATAGQSATPHNDSYIRIDPHTDIYRSSLAPRSEDGAEALATMDRDLGAEEVMQAEVDSLEAVLSGITESEAYDKLRERIDRKIDDLLIHQMDVGQRTAFISGSEYAAARDSAKVLAKQLARLGLPPNEPLVQMAKALEGSAESGMAEGKKLRKQADNEGDIFKRNSLYRQAYAQELAALRDMDRSLTVRNYLLSGRAVPGEALTYEKVEQRMFPSAVLAQAAQPEAPPAIAADTTLAVDQLKQPSAEPAEVMAAQPPVPAVHGITPHPSAVQATDSVLLSGYLNAYYYLDVAQRQQILAGEPESRYFLMKGRSMADRAQATGNRDEADGSRELARVLRAEAVSVQKDSASVADPAGQVRRLEARADGLDQRADSLEASARDLLRSADLIDAQAASLMQSIPADRSAEIMDLEQSHRRTEPLLARTRPQVATQPAVAPAAVGHEIAQADATVPGTTAQARTEPPARLAPATTTLPAAPVAFTGPLTQDIFTLNADPAPRTEPIPMDAPMPEGIVYKVQVGAFRNALPQEAFSDMAPLAGEYAGNGLVRYTAGMFTSAEKASEAGRKVRARGYRDAFVVAYMDGRRVPLNQAIQAERALAQAPALTQAPAIAQPAQVVPPAAVNLSSPTAASASEAAVLAAYPPTAEEVLAAFNTATVNTGYYNDPTAAPAKQVEAVKGLFFTVQVGVYSKPTPLDRLFSITPLNSELTANGKIRYTTGIFLDEAAAGRRKGQTVALGVADAFITAYLNGKRIPIRDARALLAKFGNAVLADPSLVDQ